jgi:hypothetical protein
MVKIVFPLCYTDVSIAYLKTTKLIIHFWLGSNVSKKHCRNTVLIVQGNESMTNMDS